MCDSSTEPASPKFCDSDGCESVATHTYVWAWGDSGFCCPTHQMVRGQQARQLKRSIQFTALTPGAPSELTRDERIRLHAEALSAIEETAAVKQRCSELYAANQELTAELRRKQAELHQVLSQVRDLSAELDQVTKEKMQALRQVAEITQEVVRVQAVLHAAETSPG